MFAKLSSFKRRLSGNEDSLVKKISLKGRHIVDKDMYCTLITKIIYRTPCFFFTINYDVRFITHAIAL